MTLAYVLLQQYSVCNACSIRPARHVHAGGGVAYCGVRPPQALASLLCLHLVADAMDLVSASHGSDRPGRVWSWLSSARKSMLLAAGAGRAVPQDLRAGTQHRPMEMRRAGIAFVTWKHVCALFVRCALPYSRRVTLEADVPSILEALVRLNKTSAVRSLIDDAGGTK